MRFANVAALLKRISPDVVIIDGGGTGFQPHQKEAKVDIPGKQTDRQALEDRFLANWQTLGGRDLLREYRFDEQRRWRFDFAVPSIKFAIEIQGGLYAPQSGHRSQEGVERDYEKLNAAQQQGWKVFQVTAKNVSDVVFLENLIAYFANYHLWG